jgi:hypothetical protein
LTDPKHPGLEAYHRAAIEQQARFVMGHLTKDQLMANLRHLEGKHGVGGFVDWSVWQQDGYTLPWEREEGPGEPGKPASQGGMR